MKYIVVINQPAAFDPMTVSPEQHAEIGAEYQRFSKLPNVTPGATLGKFQEAKFVKSNGGEASLEAAPIDQRRDIISAFWTVDVESESELLELVSQISALKLGGTVEVRPSGIYW